MTAVVSFGFNNSSMNPTVPSLRSRERPYRGHRNIFQLFRQNEDKTQDPQHDKAAEFKASHLGDRDTLK